MVLNKSNRSHPWQGDVLPIGPPNGAAATMYRERSSSGLLLHCISYISVALHDIALRYYYCWYSIMIFKITTFDLKWRANRWHDGHLNTTNVNHKYFVHAYNIYHPMPSRGALRRLQPWFRGWRGNFWTLPRLWWWRRKWIINTRSYSITCSGSCPGSQWRMPRPSRLTAGSRHQHRGSPNLRIWVWAKPYCNSP